MVFIERVVRRLPTPVFNGTPFKSKANIILTWESESLPFFIVAEAPESLTKLVHAPKRASTNRIETVSLFLECCVEGSWYPLTILYEVDLRNLLEGFLKDFSVTSKEMKRTEAEIVLKSSDKTNFD